MHLHIATVSFATFSFDQKISAQLCTWTCQPPAEICFHLGVPANSSYPECLSPWDLRRECKEMIAFLQYVGAAWTYPHFHSQLTNHRCNHNASGAIVGVRYLQWFPNFWTWPLLCCSYLKWTSYKATGKMGLLRHQSCKCLRLLVLQLNSLLLPQHFTLELSGFSCGGQMIVNLVTIFVPPNKNKLCEGSQHLFRGPSLGNVYQMPKLFFSETFPWALHRERCPVPQAL